MKKLQLITYIFVLFVFIFALINGFDIYYYEKSVNCAYKLNSDSYYIYNKYLYWEENGICCEYNLINNSIMEKCQI